MSSTPYHSVHIPKTDSVTEEVPNKRSALANNRTSIRIDGRDYEIHRLHFSSRKQAAESGYFSKSYWRRAGREVVEVERPHLVVAKSWRTFRPDEDDLVLAYSYLHYIVSNEKFCKEINSRGCWPVYRESQTVAKKSAKKCREKNRSSRLHKSSNTKTPEIENTNNTNSLSITSTSSLISSNIYVHETFDYRKVLPSSLWPYQEDAKYLLHLIYQHGVLHHGAVARKDRAVNLKYDYLTEVIDGRHFRQIRQALEEAKWLRCDHEHIAGEKSYSYSLGPKASKGKFREVALTKQNLIHKIESWKAKRSLALTDTMRHIASMLPQLELDEEQVEVCIQQGGVGSRQALVEQFMFIRNGCWFATCCDAGRLYTNITSLRTDGRNALRVNSNRLCNVDVSDSQFLALVLFIENYFKGRPLDYVQYYSYPTVSSDPLLAVDPFTIVPHFPGTSPFPLLEPQLSSVAANNSQKREEKNRKRKTSKGCHTTSIKWQKTLIHVAKNEENVLMSLQDSEWLLFRDLVQQGQLKDHVAKRLRRSRNSTKKILMQWMFGQSHREAKAAKRMEDVFPKLFNFVRQIKEGKKGNKLLAFILTRIESKLMIDTAAHRISQERPDLFLTTIHDSIMVEAESDKVDYVKSVLRETYQRQGLGVHVKVETEFKRKT